MPQRHTTGKRSHGWMGIHRGHRARCDVVAGHGEADVRRKLVETGEVDAMIAIRANFFYTRTVPCELWFFDRGKPAERRDQVLMLDARQIYRKVTRKIYDFSPEQQANLTAIVWLHRGQQDRFLGLVANYLTKMAGEADKIGAVLALFESMLIECRTASADFSTAITAVEEIFPDSKLALDNALTELTVSAQAYVADRGTLVDGISAFLKQYGKVIPSDNAGQHKARMSFNAIADQTRGLVKQIDLLYKQAARAQQLAVELAGNEAASEYLDRRATNKRIKQLDEDRKLAVEQLKGAAYFHRQVAWLQDRFPSADFVAVPGLCKAVTLAEIEAADWSLTPGRYVGVAPQEFDDDFDFEQSMRDIHVELVDLNREASELGAKIQENFEELGI